MTVARRSRLLAALVVSVLVAASCGSDDPVEVATDAPTTTTSTATSTAEDPVFDLTGTAWTLADGVDIVAGFDLTLFFDQAGASGYDGCNWFGGDFQTDGDTLTIGPLGGTDVGCRDDVLAAANAFTTALPLIQTFEVIDDRLVLRGPDVELTFDRRQSIGIDGIVDRTWILESLTTSDTTAEAGGTGGFIRLATGGAMEGGTGCRLLTGDWILATAGTAIAFPSFGAEGECNPDLFDQDSHVISVFEGSFEARVVDDRLIVTSTGGDGLVFRLAANGEEPAPPTPADQVGFDFDPSVSWSVIDLSPKEYIEVWSEPGGGSIVGEVESQQRLFAAGTETVEADGEPWRQIHFDGAEGWVPDRYLTTADGAGE